MHLNLSFMNRPLLRNAIMPVLLVLLTGATACTSFREQPIPLVYDREQTVTEIPDFPLPDVEVLPAIATLPDPLLRVDGRRVRRFSEWAERRAEIIRQLQHYELGVKPAVPREAVSASLSGDTLRVTVRVDTASLTLTAAIRYPEGEGPFPAIIGIGFPTGSLPREIFDDRGVAQIAFNFMQVMSHTQQRGSEPINRLYPEHIEMGAYSAWPWGISRLIDGLEIVGEASRIDLRHLAVSGCSFAGKMALCAGAFDERIALTIAQEPGGGGAATWRVSETLGHVETLGRTNYAWFLESMRRFSDRVDRLPVDHHELTALIAPRALLVLGNTDYEWLADESGYVSCQAARKVWEAFGIADRMGFSIEGNHPHCQLPQSQYGAVEAFVDRFLLGRDSIDTRVTHAPMFDEVDCARWMPWAEAQEQ